MTNAERVEGLIAGSRVQLRALCRTLAASLDAAERERDEAREQRDEWGALYNVQTMVIKAAQSDAATAHRLRESAERLARERGEDAERWRFLRERGDPDVDRYPYAQMDYDDPVFKGQRITVMLDGECLDAAIDAARKLEGKDG